jgi:hypothetical protein
MGRALGARGVKMLFEGAAQNNIFWAKISGQNLLYAKSRWPLLRAAAYLRFSIARLVAHSGSSTGQSRQQRAVLSSLRRIDKKSVACGTKFVWGFLQ